jgi:ABC-2 type transport system permease protein
MKPWALLTVAELKLLVRSPLAASTAILAPLAMGLFFLFGDQNALPAGHAGVVTMQLLALLGFTPYAAATTVLAARRQQLVLKRLRTSPASEGAIVAGMVLPLALLVVVQSAAFVAMAIVTTGSAPRAWWALVLAVVGGTVLAVALAFVTAAFTSRPELAQVTTLPGFLALFMGGFAVAGVAVDEVPWALLAVPGAPIAQLVRLGWDGAGLSPSTVVPSVAAMIVTASASAWLAGRVFRWQPRT